jgi:hypothetical protein
MGVRIRAALVCLSLTVLVWPWEAVAQNGNGDSGGNGQDRFGSGLPAALSDADTRLTTGIESVSAARRDDRPGTGHAGDLRADRPHG